MDIPLGAIAGVSLLLLTFLAFRSGWLLRVLQAFAIILRRLRSAARRRTATTVTPPDNSLPGTQPALRFNDLGEATVEDVMVPRADIHGIDIDDDWEVIQAQLANARHTVLPLYEDTIDNVIGFLHLRRLFAELARGTLDKQRLRASAVEPYFIPEATPLAHQLIAFRQNEQNVGLVVDEYGDIRGLVTLEDILDEVVGGIDEESLADYDITREAEDSYLVSGSVAVRTLNRVFGWQLPTDGPKTINGLIVEVFEGIPAPNTSVRVAGHPLEVVQATRNVVKLVRVRLQPPEALREAS